MSNDGKNMLDFRFWGRCTDANGFDNGQHGGALNAVGINHGGGGAVRCDNGADHTAGEGAMGMVVPYAAITSAAEPTSKSKYAHGWMWSRGSESDESSQASGMFVVGVSTSSAGALYPVTATPAQGTLVAYSLRGFLYLGTDRGIGTGQNQPSGSVAGCIGLIAKTPHPGTGQESDFQAALTGALSCSHVDAQSGHDPFYAANAANPRIAGYGLELSTWRYNDLDGSNAAFPDVSGRLNNKNIGHTGPRLIFTVPRYKNIEHAYTSGYSHTEAISGTYVFNTWYHVRMDVIPNAGFDTIKIYSAPISEALGSETWTLLKTITINDTAEYYIDWSSAGHDYNSNAVGYYTKVGRSTTIIGGDDKTKQEYLPDCLIDRFEFFTKDIS